MAINLNSFVNFWKTGHQIFHLPLFPLKAKQGLVQGYNQYVGTAIFTFYIQNV